MTLARVFEVSVGAIDIMSLGFRWVGRMLADEISFMVLVLRCHGHPGPMSSVIRCSNIRVQGLEEGQELMRLPGGCSVDSQQGCEEDTERMSGGGRGQAAQSRTLGNRPRETRANASLGIPGAWSWETA